jgi:hypothetical protein
MVPAWERSGTTTSYGWKNYDMEGEHHNYVSEGT